MEYRRVRWNAGVAQVEHRWSTGGAQVEHRRGTGGTQVDAIYLVLLARRGVG